MKSVHSAGDYRLNAMRRLAKGRRYLTGVQRSQSPARPGADVKQSAIVSERIYDNVYRIGDPIVLIRNGGRDRIFFLDEEVDHLGGGHSGDLVGPGIYLLS